MLHELARLEQVVVAHVRDDERLGVAQHALRESVGVLAQQHLRCCTAQQQQCLTFKLMCCCRRAPWLIVVMSLLITVFRAGS